MASEFRQSLHFLFHLLPRGWMLLVIIHGSFSLPRKVFRFILFRFKLFRRVWKLPGTSHLRFFPRISLKVDFLFQNSRVDRSYWYHFSSFLILYRFSQSVFEICHPFGVSKKSRNWAYVLKKKFRAFIIRFLSVNHSTKIQAQ